MVGEPSLARTSRACSWAAWLAALLTLLPVSCAGGAAAPRASHPVAAVAARPTDAAAPSCSRGTARLLASMGEPVQIDAWVTKGTAELDRFVNELERVLSGLQASGRGMLVYRVTVASTPEAQRAAKDAGLRETALGASSGYLGVAVRYGKEQWVLASLRPADRDRLAMTMVLAIRELALRVHRRTKRIGVIHGNGGIRLDEPLTAQDRSHESPTFKRILELAYPFYQLVEVDSKRGPVAIDDRLAGVIVTQPGQAFDDAQLAALDEFLMLGEKSLFIVSGAVNLRAGDAQMNARLDTHRLDELLAKYGVELKRDAVFDPSGSVTIAVDKPAPAQSVRPSWILHARKDGGLDTTFGPFVWVEQLVFPFPSTLVAHPDRQPRASLRVVARSTEQASGDTSREQAMKLSPEAPSTGPHAARAIAIAVEGEIQSAYTPGRRARGRLLVVSSPQFLSNPFARAWNQRSDPKKMSPPAGADDRLRTLAHPYGSKYMNDTITALKGILDWMSADADLDACMFQSHRH
jgi:hypothetical protein